MSYWIELNIASHRAPPPIIPNLKCFFCFFYETLPASKIFDLCNGNSVCSSLMQLTNLTPNCLDSHLVCLVQSWACSPILSQTTSWVGFCGIWDFSLTKIMFFFSILVSLCKRSVSFTLCPNICSIMNSSLYLLSFIILWDRFIHV